MPLKYSFTDCIEQVVAAPTVNGNELPNTLTDDEKTAVTNALAATDAAGLEEDQAVTTVAENLATEAGVTDVNDLLTQTDKDAGKEVKVVAYLDVKPTAAVLSGDTVSLTVEITPMYKVVAAASNATPTELAAAPALQKSNGESLTGELKNVESVDVTVGLPDIFVAPGTAKVFVKHTTNTGRQYVYEASVATTLQGTLTATFTNPHGFSEFVITATNPSAATVGSDNYATLQNALDAVANNGEITVLQNGLAAEVKSAKIFTIKLGGSAAVQPTITAISGLTVTPDGTGSSVKYTVTGTVIPPTTYTITVASASSGTVTVSPTSAAQGTEVTITATPNSGYQVDTVSVTNANNTAVTVKDMKFTMPASNVTVTVTFKRASGGSSGGSGRWRRQQTSKQLHQQRQYRQHHNTNDTG